jgi:molybdenum cofactor guanylyltransferase
MIPPAAPLLAGIFVGGAATRMGGVAKGLLPSPGGATLVSRLHAILEGIGVPVVLVGDGSSYAGVGIEHVPDACAGIGPLGGLVSLLRRGGRGHVLALACDMPFVSRALLLRLIEYPEARAVAPRRSALWEPLCARYDAIRVLPAAEAHAAAGELSLQKLLDAIGAAELPPAPSDTLELRDWDTPADVLGLHGAP